MGNPDSNNVLRSLSWLAIGFALIVTPACFAQDSSVCLETGGIQIVLPQGWEILNHPTNVFTQQRARNRDTGVAVSAGAFKVGLTLEQYMAVGIAAFELSPEQQVEKISKLTEIPTAEIESALDSQIGRKILAGMQRAHDTMQFELESVKKIKISGVTAYDAMAKLTVLKSGQVMYSRQLTLNGTSPDEIVNIAFVGSSDDVFQDESLVNSIRIKNSGVALELGGYRIVLPTGWQQAKFPPDANVQYCAFNPRNGITMNAGAFKSPLTLETFVAVIIAGTQQTGTDYEKIATLTAVPSDKIKDAFDSDSVRQLLQDVRNTDTANQFYIRNVEVNQISGVQNYEIESTSIKQGETKTTYSRQFLLNGNSPGELVKVTFVGHADNVLQDQSLIDTIKIK